MKKSELKSGMLVFTREGKRALVLKDAPYGDCLVGNGNETNGNQTWLPLNSYNEDLMYSQANQNIVDIIEVWGYSNNMLGANLTTRDRELLWKREEVKKEVELTLEEIAAKFNINIQQLKIKK